MPRKFLGSNQGNVFLLYVKMLLSQASTAYESKLHKINVSALLNIAYNIKITLIVLKSLKNRNKDYKFYNKCNSCFMQGCGSGVTVEYFSNSSFQLLFKMF